MIEILTLYWNGYYPLWISFWLFFVGGTFVVKQAFKFLLTVCTISNPRAIGANSAIGLFLAGGFVGWRIFSSIATISVGWTVGGFWGIMACIVVVASWFTDD